MEIEVPTKIKISLPEVPKTIGTNDGRKPLSKFDLATIRRVKKEWGDEFMKEYERQLKQQ